MFIAKLMIVAGLANSAATAEIIAGSRQPTAGAIYFGDWHIDTQHAELHGENWTEFTLPIHATPRFPGHLQPNIPLSAPGFGMEPENGECSRAELLLPTCVWLHG